MGVGIGDVGFSLVKELGIERSTSDGADGIVVSCFHLGDLVKIEVELFKSDFLVHVGDVLDDEICVELVGRVITLY